MMLYKLSIGIYHILHIFYLVLLVAYIQFSKQIKLKNNLRLKNIQ